jgi:hypothetical protein
LEHTESREAVVLSPQYTDVRNKVWLSVRRQALAAAG